MEEKTLTINLEPSRYSREDVIKLCKEINRQVKAGAKLVLEIPEVKPQTIIVEGAGAGPYSGQGGGSGQTEQ